MSSAGISFGGLASGLDTQAIISALTALERRPISQLETKKTSLNKQKSLFGDLSSLLQELTKKAKALQTTTNFLEKKATSSDEDVLKVSASTSAVAGTYEVTVNTLARSQLTLSAGQSSPTATFGGPASLQIEVDGNTHFIAVTTPTLASIAEAINAQDIGVNAEVVDTGNTANGGAQRYQLALRATTPGTEGAFTVTYDDGDAAFQSFVSGLTTTAGTNASVTIGGVTVQRSTNTISDAITGVTLDLLSVNAPGTVQVTVATDAEEVSKKVQDFVDAYNKVVDFATAQNALDAEGKASSPLFGDSLLRNVRSSLRTIAGGQVGTGNDAYQMLSQVGIAADTAGRLTFTSTKFAEALAADEDAVAAIFTTDTTGLMNRFVDQLDVYTDSVDGLFKARNESFDRQVQDAQRRIDDAERRLEIYTEQLQKKYANLESLLAQLQGQGSSLSGLNNLSTRR